jgi:DNA-binding LacI/PurR family transcriptional regulator
MTTIKDVARLANVSVGTVSKVLTNTPYVADETRARVIRVIEDTGYNPSLVGRALSKGRTQNIGIIFPHRGADRLFSDPYHITVLQAIERVLSEHEYNIMLSAPMVPYESAQQFQRLLGSRYLDGALTFEILANAPLRPYLEAHHIPCLSLNYHPATALENTLYVDDYVGARALAEYALSLGHRRIALITVPPATLGAWELRMRGYRAAFDEASVDFDSLCQVEGDFTVESGRAAVIALIEGCGSNLPTCILCFNDRMAIGAMQELQSRGLRVPDDVSIAGFDDIPLVQTLHPALTTVRQPADLLGTRAAETMLEWMKSSPDRRKQAPATLEPIIIPSELVVRESLKPVGQ